MQNIQSIKSDLID